MKNVLMIVEDCKALNHCYNGTKGDCRGCNVWNILYNHIDFDVWCIKQNKDPETVENQMRKEYLKQISSIITKE